MPERLRFNISMPGKNSVNSRPPLSLAKAIDLIKQKKYNDEMEANIIKAISKQPSNTYEAFLTDINKHIDRINKQKDKE